jgi:DNA-binding winged helix-turn-helix (wHTH) protein/TolB-like protein/Tfp pilus assembly protein PilF
LAASKQQRQVYEFGPFRLDVAERLLLKDEQTISLPPKVFDTLVVLAENSGRLVTRDELMSRLWPDTFVEEATLARNISDLRKALSEASGGQRFIETVPRHGYRFTASVRQPLEAVDLTIEAPSESQEISQQEISAEPVVDEKVEPQSLDLESKIGKKQYWLSRPAALAALGLLIALAAGFSFFVISKSSHTKPEASTQSIAVLPLNYLGGEESESYIEVAMADAIINKLSKIKQIVIRPTSAVTKYNHLQQDALAAGRELGVDLVLDGHIQRSGDRARISVQMISVKDGSTLWAETFDSKWTDLFAAQDSVSEQIIEALALKLISKEEKLLSRHDTESDEARQAYMKGRFWWSKRTPEGFRRAIEFFNEAIALDRNYALPYAGLADCYTLLSPSGLAGLKESYPKAKAAATQALALDNQLAEAHASLAHITWLYDWDFVAAEARFKQAIELGPNYPTAHQWYSVYLSSMGRHDEAIAEAKRAHELDPLSIPIIRDLSRAYYHAHQYDQAIETYMKVLELDPQYHQLNSWLELAYAQKGLYDQAIEARSKALNRLNVDPEKIASMKDIYARSGWKGYWQKELESAVAKGPNSPLFNYFVARIYARLGQNEQALTHLEKAYEERLDHMVLLKVDPVFDPLRSDPRFADLIRRMGFTSS